MILLTLNMDGNFLGVFGILFIYFISILFFRVRNKGKKICLLLYRRPTRKGRDRNPVAEPAPGGVSHGGHPPGQY